MKTHSRSLPHVYVFTLIVTASLSSPAKDWAQWRGPNRDGLSTETGLLAEWLKDGPKLLWQVRDIGAGYSTPSIVGDRIYLLSNEGLSNEFALALSARDGSRLWSAPLGKVGNPKQNPNYPAARSTPTVEGDVLYALGSDGDLVCLEQAKGRERWRKNLRSDFGGKPGEWAYSESPLIDGDALVCTPGGSNATVVALNKKSGEVIWKCAVPGGDEAAYASAIVVQDGGVKQYVQLLQKGLVGVEAKNGKFLWRYAKAVSRYGANVPSPYASDGAIYTAAAGTGGGAVQLVAKDGAIEPQELYFQAKLPAVIGSVVKVGDYIFGTGAQTMQCFEFKTGNIKWEERALGPAAMLVADGRLYVHSESGDVALVEPSPEAYREKGHFTPPDLPGRSNPMEKAWSYPVLADGRLYIRDKNLLYCYDVKAGR